jgi:hypothetical protein
MLGVGAVGRHSAYMLCGGTSILPLKTCFSGQESEVWLQSCQHDWR